MESHKKIQLAPFFVFFFFFKRIEKNIKTGESGGENLHKKKQHCQNKFLHFKNVMSLL
jgi:hypothetical protein